MPKTPENDKTFKEKFIGFFKHEPDYYIKWYKLEIGCLMAFAHVFFFFYRGKNTNAALAVKWCQTSVKMFGGQFQHLGCGKKPSIAVMQRSYADFEYYASDRLNLHYVEFRLNFMRRHCALTYFCHDMIKGYKDQLEIQIPIDIGNRQLPLEFFICRRKDAKKKMEELKHLKNYVKNSNAKNYKLNDDEMANKNSLMIMSEHDEISNHIIS